MRKIKAKKKVLVVLLLVLIMLITVGYSSLSTTLTISGNSTVKKKNWNIYFDNIVETHGSVAVAKAPTIDATKTEVTWEVTLEKPGDFYEFTVDAVNAGDLDAMIGNLSNSTLSTEQGKYLKYAITYADGGTIEQYDKLNAGETVAIKVRLEFRTDINVEDLPSEAEKITLTYTSEYVQADSNAKDRNNYIIKIGDTVNYTTILNGVELSNWKVFYKEGDYIYLMLGDYLPNAAVNIAGMTKNGTYTVHSGGDRTALINAMTTKSNWDSLLIGTMNGKAINETRSEEVWAMGSPTIELWIKSWNASYQSDKLYTAYSENVDNTGYDGYYIGETANPTSDMVDLSIKAGYNNTLYFPHKGEVGEEACFAYWLSSPSASHGLDDGASIDSSSIFSNVMCVYYEGTFAYCSCGHGADCLCSFRPIIRLPSSILE